MVSKETIRPLILLSISFAIINEAHSQLSYDDYDDRIFLNGHSRYNQYDDEYYSPHLNRPSRVYGRRFHRKPRRGHFDRRYRNPYKTDRGILNYGTLENFESDERSAKKKYNEKNDKYKKVKHTNEFFEIPVDYELLVNTGKEKVFKRNEKTKTGSIERRIIIPTGNFDLPKDFHPVGQNQIIDEGESMMTEKMANQISPEEVINLPDRVISQ